MSESAIVVTPSPVTAPPQASSGQTAASAGGKGHVQAWHDKDGPGFSDILDAINPLQHIPIISTLYRHLTGDTEGAASTLAGGTAYGSLLGMASNAVLGGIIGLGVGLVDVVVRDATGEDIGEHIYNTLFGSDGDGAKTAQSGNTAGGPQTAAAASPVGDEPPAPAAAPPVPVQTLDTTLAAAAPAAAATPAQGDGTAAKLSDVVQEGSYLVFGGSETPITVNRTPTSLLPSRQAAAPQAVATPVFQTAEAATGLSARQGDYVVFGGSQDAPAAPSAAPSTAAVAAASATAAAPAATSPEASETPMQAAAQSAGNGAEAAFAQTQPHLKPLPPRRAPMMPSPLLPQPTTGPAAVGRGQSQAVNNPAPKAPPNDWFAQTFNQNMDKLDRMQASNGAAAYQSAMPVN
ncbi:hypothetical protein GALL_99450 [mine drainage metagenome]|uniref:Uncharacterized protein n=1 Tax=mine drainage metagenome TaxID=410659 RepID=A0A1J5SI09_9ZZZZ